MVHTNLEVFENTHIRMVNIRNFRENKTCELGHTGYEFMLGSILGGLGRANLDVRPMFGEIRTKSGDSASKRPQKFLRSHPFGARVLFMESILPGAAPTLDSCACAFDGLY